MNYWNTSDIQFLKTNAGKMTASQIAKQLKKPVYAVYWHARQLHLNISTRWTPEAVGFLKANAKEMTVRQLALALKKPERGVRRKLESLKIKPVHGGRKRWSDEEKEFLRENPCLPLRQKADLLNRSKEAIMKKQREVRNRCLVNEDPQNRKHDYPEQEKK